LQGDRGVTAAMKRSSEVGSKARGCLVWIAGRPSAGKSTLAVEVRRELARRALPCVVLDGDEVRRAIAPDLGYSREDRDVFYAALARLGAMLVEQGLIVIVAATANRTSYREAARARVPVFVEVLVDTPLEECERRDEKGLYAKARQGGATELPGVDGCAFEPSAAVDVIARGGLDRDAIQRIVERAMEAA
jgi:adenylylsulfate kinase